MSQHLERQSYRSDPLACCAHDGEVEYISQSGRAGPRRMDCRKVADLSLEFLEGGLPEDERQSFERHLDACGPCVAFFETYRKTPEISRGALQFSMPERVRAAVRSYLRERCCREGVTTRRPEPG